MNTSTCRIYPDDEKWMREISYERLRLRVDTKPVSPARITKAIRRLIESDATLLKRLKEAPFK